MSRSHLGGFSCFGNVNAYAVRGDCRLHGNDLAELLAEAVNPN